MNRTRSAALFIVVASALFAGCASVPDGVATVEAVEFETADGFTLRGDVYHASGDARASVILVHSLFADRSSFRILAPRFAIEGCDVAIPDLRGHGQSIARGEATLHPENLTVDDFAMMDDDLIAFSRNIAQPENAFCFALGTGLGASVAVEFVRANGAWQGLVLVNPRVEFKGLKTLETCMALEIPMLIVIRKPRVRTITNEAGEEVEVAEKNAFREALGDKAEFIEVEAGSAMNMEEAAMITDGVFERIIEWTSENRAKPVAQPAADAAPETGAPAEDAEDAEIAVEETPADETQEPAAAELPAETIAPEREVQTIPLARENPGTIIGADGVEIVEDSSSAQSELAEIALRQQEAISRLEARTNELEQKLDSSISSAASESGEYEPKFSGYLDVAFIDVANEHPSLEASGLGLSIEANLPLLDVGADVEFKNAGKIDDPGNVYTLGSETDSDFESVRVSRARFDFGVIANSLRLSGGVVPLPIGRLNAQHFSFQRNLVSLPLSSRALVPALWRDVAIGISGEPTYRKERFSFEAFAVNGVNGEIFDGRGLRGAVSRDGISSDFNSTKSFVGRFGYKPGFIRDFEVGLSSFYGKYDDRSANGIFIACLDGYWSVSELEFRGEGVYIHIDENTGGRPIPERMQGMYFETAWKPTFGFVSDFLGLLAHEEESAMRLVLRYDYIDTDYWNETSGDRKAASAGVRLDLSANFIFKFEYRFDIDRNRIQNIDQDTGVLLSFTALF
ncbi:MAG: alpha/beta fold hydrolase [Planctomycetes bacterium]|nr:alpha/beta fold hydrolase [Planctomycetota bacterium]